MLFRFSISLNGGLPTKWLRLPHFQSNSAVRSTHFYFLTIMLSHLAPAAVLQCLFSTGLFLVNRQISCESLAYFYVENRFISIGVSKRDFPALFEMCDFSKQIPLKSMSFPQMDLSKPINCRFHLHAYFYMNLGGLGGGSSESTNLYVLSLRQLIPFMTNFGYIRSMQGQWAEIGAKLLFCSKCNRENPNTTRKIVEALISVRPSDECPFGTVAVNGDIDLELSQSIETALKRPPKPLQTVADLHWLLGKSNQLVSRELYCEALGLTRIMRLVARKVPSHLSLWKTMMPFASFIGSLCLINLGDYLGACWHLNEGVMSVVKPQEPLRTDEAGQYMIQQYLSARNMAEEILALFLSKLPPEDLSKDPRIPDRFNTRPVKTVEASIISIQAWILQMSGFCRAHQLNT